MAGLNARGLQSKLLITPLRPAGHSFGKRSTRAPPHETPRRQYHSQRPSNWTWHGGRHLPHRGTPGPFSFCDSGPPPLTSSCSQTAPAPSAMVPTVRDSGLTGGGPRSSCSTASNGRNFTPLCWQPSPGATSGPPFASISCATIRPWCSVWCLARHTARTSCPSSVTFPYCCHAQFHHICTTFPVCTTLSLTIFPVSTCRCSAHMLQKPCPTQPPSHLLSLQQDMRLYLHHSLATSTRNTQRSHTQLHHIHSHIQPTLPQRITHAGLGTHTHAIPLMSCTHPKATIHKGVPLCSQQHAPGARAPRPHVRRPQPPPLDERNQAGAWLSSGPQTAYHTHHTQLILPLLGALASGPPISQCVQRATRYGSGPLRRIHSASEPLSVSPQPAIPRCVRSQWWTPSSQPPAKERDHCFACRMESV